MDFLTLLLIFVGWFALAFVVAVIVGRTIKSLNPDFEDQGRERVGLASQAEIEGEAARLRRESMESRIKARMRARERGEA